jgi:hypothetical protein
MPLVPSAQASMQRRPGNFLICSTWRAPGRPRARGAHELARFRARWQLDRTVWPLHWLPLRAITDLVTPHWIRVRVRWVIIDRVFTLYRCWWYWCGRLCRLLLLETMLACLPHLICFRLIALHRSRASRCAASDGPGCTLTSSTFTAFAGGG